MLTDLATVSEKTPRPPHASNACNPPPRRRRPPQPHHPQHHPRPQWASACRAPRRSCSATWSSASARAPGPARAPAPGPPPPRPPAKPSAGPCGRGSAPRSPSTRARGPSTRANSTRSPRARRPARSTTAPPSPGTTPWLQVKVDPNHAHLQVFGYTRSSAGGSPARWRAGTCYATPTVTPAASLPCRTAARLRHRPLRPRPRPAPCRRTSRGMWGPSPAKRSTPAGDCGRCRTWSTSRCTTPLSAAASPTPSEPTATGRWSPSSRALTSSRGTTRRWERRL